MRWKQFLTSVQSVDADAARAYMEKTNSQDFTLLDVRQPKEYEKGHIPGAKLVPLPDLPRRLDELDPKKGTIVYCAVGGRSRVAAQMLSAEGFGEVYNLKGGFKAWHDVAAVGSESQGLELFTGSETPDLTLEVAYSLEQGLLDFYRTMEARVTRQDAKGLFRKLASVEITHQEKIWREYIKISKKKISREDFEKNVLVRAAEGGITTEEYLRLFPADPESLSDIIGLAMSIEAQALDLYRRAADRTGSTESRTVLLQIASEEISHLQQLGKLMDGIL